MFADTADMALFYVDADLARRSDASEFRGHLNVADIEPLDGVKVGDYTLQHPTAVGLARGETLVFPAQDLTLRVLDVNRIGDGAESRADLVLVG
jgi:hypothetical protein